MAKAVADRDTRTARMQILSGKKTGDRSVGAAPRERTCTQRPIKWALG